MFEGVCAVTHNLLSSLLHPHFKKPTKQIFIKWIPYDKYATTLILINKNSGNKFILWR